MKTKTKMVVLMEIAVVLCSVLLVATLPAIAAEQSQEMQKVSVSEVMAASEDDYTLDLYGNANEDDTIDMRDVTYTKLIIFGKKSETKLADAYYDDEVDVLDVVQIKLIILGRESELTIIDSADRTVTVKEPINRVVVFNHGMFVTMRSIKATDKVVGQGFDIWWKRRDYREV
jgi:iron complex transport system substrate-binding protein